MKHIVCILLFFVGLSVSAQKVAVKTNVYCMTATTTLNLGAEFRIAPKWQSTFREITIRLSLVTQEDEALASTAGSTLLALRGIQRAFLCLTCFGRRIQCRQYGFRYLSFHQRCTLRGGMYGAGIGLRIPIYLGKPLEFRIGIGAGWIHATGINTNAPNVRMARVGQERLFRRDKSCRFYHL